MQASNRGELALQPCDRHHVLGRHVVYFSMRFFFIIHQLFPLMKRKQQQQQQQQNQHNSSEETIFHSQTL